MDIDVEGIIKKSVELRNEMVGLRQEQKLLKMTVGETNEEYIKTEARLKKVSAEYNLNQKQVSSFSQSSKDFLSVQQKLTSALDKEVASISSAAANNAELKKIRNEVNAKTVEGQAAIATINKKLDENTNFIKSNVSELEHQKIGIGDYKNQIKEAYGEMNIMNGGLLGFIGRSKEAGGVMPLVTNGLKGVGTGIWGVIKASLAFIATPIGFVIAVFAAGVALLSSYLKGFTPLMDKVAQVSAGFGAALEVVQRTVYDFIKGLTDLGGTLKKITGFITSPIQSFKDLGASMSEAADDASKLVKAQQDLEDSMRLQEVGNARAKQQVEQLILQSKNRLLTEQQKMDLLAQAEKIESDNFNERTKRANITIEQAKQDIKNVAGLTEAQKKAIDERGLAAAQELQDQFKISDEQLNILKTAELGKIEILSESTKRQEKIQNESDKAFEIQQTEKQKQNDLAMANAKTATDNALKESKTQLDIFIADQGVKAKTLQEELVLAEQISTKKIDILKAELSAKKITQSEYNLAILEIDNDLISKRAEITTDLASRELQDYIQQHQNKIDNDIFFSAESLRLEQERLDGIATKQKEFAKTQLEQGVINQTAYNDAIKAVDEETRIAKEEAQLLRDEAEKEKKIVDLENQRILDEENFNSQLEIDLARLAQSYEEEKKAADKTGADVNLITQKYLNTKKQMEDAARETKLNADGQAFGQIADFLGKETVLGKVAALAQAGINIQLGITKALASKGFAGIVEGVLIAAKGAVSVAKISATQPPKAERGMVIDIGGDRHSGGGTKFYGEDGTAFEAERGEKMFILNRQASAALEPLLSDINQQYGGVALSKHSAYLASGGQVARNNNSRSTQNINVDTSGIKEAVYQGSKEGIQTANIKVVPSEIIDMYNENQAVVKNANR